MPLKIFGTWIIYKEHRILYSSLAYPFCYISKAIEWMHKIDADEKRKIVLLLFSLALILYFCV